MLIWRTGIDSVVSWRLCLSVLDCDMRTESWCAPEGGREQTLRQNACQHLEAQLQRLAQQREDTKTRGYQNARIPKRNSMPSHGKPTTNSHTDTSSSWNSLGLSTSILGRSSMASVRWRR
jgi:hypothetical protein